MRHGNRVSVVTRHTPGDPPSETAPVLPDRADGFRVEADIVVVGGGASATLLVAALRRRGAASPVRVVVIGAGHAPGRGVAYSSSDGQHLMNVPVMRLSVDPDDPEHLLRWLVRSDPRSARLQYIPRRVYGDYLAAVLAGGAAGRDGPDRVAIEVVPGRVASVEATAAGWAVMTNTGPTVHARVVVLAVGSIPGPAPIEVPDDERVARDPWAPGALDRLAGRKRVLVVGSGLTMVDVTLTLAAQGSEVCAVSRHGWLPGTHPDLRVPAARPITVPAGPLTAAGVRRLVVEHARREPNGWQAAMDDLRDRADEIWSALPRPEQRKLLRRGLSAWTVHRHRMAPVVSLRLDALVTDGRVRVHRGTAVAVSADADGVELSLRRKGHVSALRGDAVVLCTGSAPDVGRTDDPLLMHLLDAGTASVGPHHLGVAVDGRGAMLDRRGQPQASLFVLGELRRGTSFETTAIPELRAQAEALAPILLACAQRPEARARCAVVTTRA